MAHVDRITARLPVLYAQGELLGTLLAHPGLAFEIVDEDLLEIRRAHFFDQALELDEAARLAALLDLAPEDWQDAGVFRAWVHALRNATLEHGAAGVRALQVFVEEYTRRLTDAVRVPRLVVSTPNRAADWGTDPYAPDRASFVENPLRTATASPGHLPPLSRFTLTNAGLDPAPAGLLYTGLATGPEYVPVTVNLTTGDALVYLDAVPPGKRLALHSDGTAFLENRDVTDRVRHIAQVVPGQPWALSDAQPARPLTLARGGNDMWFLTVAHHDSPGLDRVLLALADLELTQGAYDAARLDHALFAQDAAVRVSAAWRETTPAAVHVTLPAGYLLSKGAAATALPARDRLGTALGDGLNRLSAAGVDATGELAPFRETQPQSEYLTGVDPALVIREGGPSGADALPESGGLFDVTPFEDSTFR